MSSAGGALTPTKRGHEFAMKADTALREGKTDEAKTWHKHASNAFKEARDSLMEGDTNTRMALKILIDYHRDREKNPGDPKYVQPKVQSGSQPLPTSIEQPSFAPLSMSSSTNSLPDAWNAVQEFAELLQTSVTPPPLPESTSVSAAKTTGFNAVDWKKGNQSVMAESYYIVGGETIAPLGNGATSALNAAGNSNSQQKATASSEKLQAANRLLTADVERLTKEANQLRSMLLRERDETKVQRERFWKMFVLVKAALEDAKAPPPTGSAASYESELKALTRLLHAESEARKRVEAELDELKRNFS